MSHLQGGRFPSQDPDLHEQHLAEASEQMRKDRVADHVAERPGGPRHWWQRLRRRDR